MDRGVVDDLSDSYGVQEVDDENAFVTTHITRRRDSTTQDETTQTKPRQHNTTQHKPRLCIFGLGLGLGLGVG